MKKPIEKIEKLLKDGEKLSPELKESLKSKIDILSKDKTVKK